MICIHHIDMDGFCAAAIVKLAHPEVQLIPWNYGQDVPPLDFDEEIIMVDVSFPIPDMVDLALNRKFTWIDHHEKTIKQFVVSSEGRLYPEYKAHLRVGVGACQLAWEHFFPGQPLPLIVDLISHYDVFRTGGRYNWDGYVVPVQKGLELVVNNPDDMLAILQNVGVDYPEQLKSVGSTVIQYQKKLTHRVMNSYFEADLNAGGAKALCLNTHLFDNSMFDRYFNPEVHQVAIAFHFDGKLMKWKFSFRSYGRIFDCAAFAAQYGGGGHFNAAGCEVSRLDDVLPGISNFKLPKIKANPKAKPRKKK